MGDQESLKCKLRDYHVRQSKIICMALTDYHVRKSNIVCMAQTEQMNTTKSLTTYCLLQTAAAGDL